MPAWLKRAYKLLQDAGRGFADSGDSLLAGAVAFYTLLSAAPLLVITVAVAGFIFGEETARSELFSQLRGVIGPSTTKKLAVAMKEARLGESGGLAATLSAVVLLFGASRLFVHLQRALNHVMSVRLKRSSFKAAAKKVLVKRLWSFAMVIGCGFLLTLLLMARTVASALLEALEDVVHVPWIYQVTELLLSFGLLASLFAVLYKVLPDVRLHWADAWIGGSMTAVMLALGTLPIGWFIGSFGTTSAYGAAGALVILLLWVYYASLIFFFGAELTRAWAEQKGRGLEPEPYAQRVVAEEREGAEAVGAAQI